MTPPVIKNLLEQLHATLRPSDPKALFADGRPVYIYGAGNAGKDVCGVLTSHGISVTGFLDRNAKPDAIWQGIPILTPDDLRIPSAQRQRSHVVVGIHNHLVEMPPLHEALRLWGYGRITSFLELHEQFADELGDRYWLTSRHFYADKKEPISDCDQLWSDERSRELYAAVLKYRFTKSYEVLPQPDFGDQYFPKGLPPWPSPIRFIDCGAYDGDTLRDLMDGRTKIEAIAAFKPDPGNFRKLVESVRARISTVTETLSLFPCGVSSKTGQIRFSSGLGTSSYVSEKGDTVIEGIKLDDALPAFRPNVIKMDIEGAEVDAMLGARQMIEAHRPGLAICVYHKPDHLWKIPLLAQSWLKGGHHYLRMHTYNTYELIYYWMP